MSVEFGGTPECPSVTCNNCGIEYSLTPENGVLRYDPTAEWFMHLFLQCPSDDCNNGSVIYLRDSPREVYKDFLPEMQEFDHTEEDVIVEMFKASFDIVDLEPRELSPNEEVDLRDFHNQLEGVEPFDIK